MRIIFPKHLKNYARLKKRLFSKEMYKGVIVSEDGTATIIIFSLYDNANIQELANTVKQKTESLHLPEHIYYAGSPMMITSIAHLISADLTRLLPIAFVLIAFVLFLGFRSIQGYSSSNAHCYHCYHLGYWHYVAHGSRNEYGFK